MPNERQRRQIAAEAARLLVTHTETDYTQAKLAAARQLCQGPVRSEDLPTNAEVLAHAEALADGGAASLDALHRPDAATFDRFHFYAMLLAPLEQVVQDAKSHPEGDALYHSLQVFELARQQLPYDEDFLLAALLHDVGKAIDPRDHVAAGLAALDGFVSERTAWLIEHHPDATAIRRGTLGHRARKRLEANESFDELVLLGQCDREGRQCGVQVPDFGEALQYVRGLDEAHGE
ncbi:MAG: HD domain-containing protein [Planctomycetia bacterium]|nr:HD domain-containing protein [Planctomycetia bacterium]